MSNSPFDHSPSDDASHDPYAASRAASPVTQTRLPKPTSLTVFGILNLVFGAMGICGTGLGAIGLFAQDLFPRPAGAQPDPFQQIMNENEAYRLFVMVSLVIGLFAIITVIIAGMGLLNGKSYGRTLSIWYGIYGIISVIVGIISHFVFVMGPLTEMLERMPNGPEKMGAQIGMYSPVFGSCIGLIYPVLLLIFMKRRVVVEYFQKQNRNPYTENPA